MLVEMAGAAAVKAVLRNQSFDVIETDVSYVKCLIPELEAHQIVFLHKSLTPIDSPKVNHSKTEHDQSNISEFEVTGSPLECSFGNDRFEEAAIIPQRNWTKEEESQFPLTRSEACVAINLCMEYLDNNWLLPVLAVCDGKDSDQTVLLGAQMKGGWFTSIDACTVGLKKLSELRDVPSLLLQEHVKLSSAQQHEVNISAFSVHELFGMRREITDWKDVSVSSFAGSLNIEVNWNSLSFHPPLRNSTCTLVMEVCAGWDSSPLKRSWEQLMLLYQYLKMLTKYQNKNTNSRYSVMPLQFSSDFSPLDVKSAEEVTEQLNLLLCGDNTLDEDTFGQAEVSIKEQNIEDIKLGQHAHDVHSRQNKDFTDKLWQLLSSSADYAQVTDCIHTVFEEILIGNSKPQINSSNPTRLAKIISDLIQHKAASPSLAGSLPLELLLDAGLEKMSRDYTYLLLSSHLIELHDLQHKLCNVSTGPFKIEHYWKKLTSLAQIHVCSEFVVLTENYLDCTTTNLQSIFNFAFRQFVSEKSPIQSFPHLLENRINSLRAPLPSVIVENFINGSPSSWRLTLSSKSPKLKVETCSHNSRVPIFPSNIISADINENAHNTTDLKEEQYYSTLRISTSNKMH